MSQSANQKNNPSGKGSQRETKVLAAIDVGSNSIRLVVAEASADGHFRVLDDEKVSTRLGTGLNETGNLQPGPIEASIEAMERMQKIAEGYGAGRIRVVGTSASRVAKNKADFVRAIHKRTGLKLEVLSGEEEAKLAYLSVRRAFELDRINAAVVDIGGGSTEMVLSAGGVVQQVFSVDTGAVRLTERFGTCEGGANDGYRQMRRYLREVFRKHFEEPGITPHVMFGTGGTFTSLASMELNRTGVAVGEFPAAVRGFELLRSDVKIHLDSLRKMSVDQRREVLGLSPDRAPIVVAGLCAVEVLMKHLGVNCLRVHDRGIREGMLFEMMEDAFPPAVAPAPSGSPMRMAGVRAFGERCRYDAPNVEHVAMLAGSLFDQLSAAKPTSGAWAADLSRELLVAAALLHDVGYFINYSKHHKHSYHLIVHSDLPGFTHRELELIANIARYHRRAEPKLKHAPYATLAIEDRLLVEKLSGILRLAVGLDRTHAQAVRGVKVASKGNTVNVTALAPHEPIAEVWGAKDKKGLLEKSFGVTVNIDWAPIDADAKNTQ